MGGILLKQVSETKYLFQDNTWRYRAIIRYIFKQYERYRYHIGSGEIYKYLIQSDYFNAYRIEDLDNDLSALTEWGNLSKTQETGHVQTFNDFINKRNIYQLTPYTVEIERTIIKLEESADEIGGSLKSSAIEKLYISILKVADSDEYVSPSNAGDLLKDVFDNWKQLNTSTSDYLSYLSSAKLEEMFTIDTFLVYKDALTERLRTFIKVLQDHIHKFKSALQGVSEEKIRKIARLSAEDYLSIPRDEVFSIEDLSERYYQQWMAIYFYFLKVGDGGNEVGRLIEVTEGAIRSIARQAQRFGERNTNFKSRYNEYLHLAKVFDKIEETATAHKLFASVFGVFNTKHLYAFEKETENHNAYVWEHKPSEIVTTPRTRSYGKRRKLNAVKDNSKEKAEAIKKYLEERAKERMIIEDLLSGERLVLSDIRYTSKFVRETILGWIGRCMVNRDNICLTDIGKKLKLRKIDQNKIIMRFDDGTLEMPNFEFQIL